MYDEAVPDNTATAGWNLFRTEHSSSSSPDVKGGELGRGPVQQDEGSRVLHMYLNKVALIYLCLALTSS